MYEGVALPRLGKVVLLCASVLAFVQGSVLAPALVELARSLPESEYSSSLLARLIFVAPTLTLVLSAAYVGKLADRCEKRILLIGGIAGYAACGVWAFFSESAEGILGARLALGITLAAITTVTTALIGDYFSGQDREGVLGWQNALRGAVNTVGPVAGGLVAMWNWRLVFLINLVALLLIWPMAKFPSVLPIKRVSRRLIMSSTLWLIYLLVLFGFLVLYLVTLQISFHLAEMGIGGSLWAGAAISMAAVSAALCSTQYVHIRRWLSYPAAAAAAFALTALGYGLIAIAAVPQVVSIGLAIAGLGFGLNAPNCLAWLLSEVGPEVRGRALGRHAMAMFSGQLLSPFLYEWMVTELGSSGAFAATGAACMMISACVAFVAGQQNGAKQVS